MADAHPYNNKMVAPVRETVSQTLASLLLHMPSRSVSHVHNVLLDMIMHAAPSGGKGRAGKGRDHGWEVRHAGLLGIKYEVAVRTDLVEKEEDGKMGMLGGIVDAALMGYVFSERSIRSNC
jgi:TATA-binding protein-associated factor